jgi:hypothetical protein
MKISKTLIKISALLFCYPALADVRCAAGLNNSSDAVSVVISSDTMFKAVAKSGQFTAVAQYNPGLTSIVMEIYEGQPTALNPGPDAIGTFDASSTNKPHLYYSSKSGDYMTLDCSTVQTGSSLDENK